MQIQRSAGQSYGIRLLGKAGVVEEKQWYVGVAERAATAAASSKRPLTIIIDYTGTFATIERPVSRKHWVIGTVSHATDPDDLGAMLHRAAIVRGFDTGARNETRRRK